MKRVFLVGYMGAGKTTVGKELAKLAGLSFIDLHYYIEGRYHKAVSQIFAERGEEAFREIERNMLHEVAEFEDVLISTGGGAPCFFDNMEYMNSMGDTVFLEASDEALLRRLKAGKSKRPLLTRRSQRQEAQVDIPVPGVLHSLPLQRQLLHLSAPRLCNSCLPDRQPSDR